MRTLPHTLAALTLGLAAAAQAATPVLPATGVDAAGMPLAPGELDPHYTVSGGGLSDAPTYATQNATGFPGYWLAPGAGSSWITPALAGLDAGNLDAVVYTYTTRFDLGGFDPATARIDGRVAIDDRLDAILLNGQDIGFRASGYGSFKDFSIGSGFVAGVNTLSFVVDNVYGGPSGLRAEMALVAAPVPEPASALLLAAGAMTLLTLRRRPATPLSR